MFIVFFLRDTLASNNISYGVTSGFIFSNCRDRMLVGFTATYVISAYHH